MKITHWIFFIVTGAGVFLFYRNRRLEEENTRLNGNVETLTGEICRYRVNDSLNAAGVNRLSLTKSELERYNADLALQIKAMDVKLKRVQSVSRTATQMRYDVGTVAKDSVVLRFRDSMVFDTLRCISYSNGWISLSGCLRNDDSALFHVACRDTLVQVVHRVPKKFLFFRFGCKAIRQEIMSKNPHGEIVYTKYIEIR